MNDWSQYLVTIQRDIVSLTDAMNQRRYYDAAKIASTILGNMNLLMMWIVRETINKGRHD